MSVDEQERSQESIQEQDQVPQIPESLGAWLKASRLEAGLAVDEVARELKLAGSTVLDLESDRTQHIGAPIYYRGFVRAYAKMLDLPLPVVESRLNTLLDSDPMPRVAEGTIPVRQSRWMERYTLMASYVVGTALVLPLLYWLVSSDGTTRVVDQTDRSELALPVLDSDSTVDTTTDGASENNGDTAAPASAAAQLTTSTEDSDSESSSAPVAASLTPFGLGRGATAAPTSGQEIALQLEQASWVALVDASGERLVYRTLSAGRHVLSGQAPLELRLGNASRSQLFIAGQAVDLQAYSRGNIAKLTLTADGQGQLQAAPASAE